MPHAFFHIWHTRCDHLSCSSDLDMMDEMSAANSPPMILQRIQSDRIAWAGPLAMATARTALILLVQAGVATAFLIRGDPSPWRAQAPWWTVYATLVDIGCLLLLWRQANREGIRLFDLFGIDRSGLGREVLWGLLYFVALFPIVAGFGSRLASWLVYGTSRDVGARPVVGTPPSALGGRLQFVSLLAGLVADRRSHLPSLLRSPTPSFDRQYVGHGNVGRFLVGLPTQCVPTRVRLAPNRLSFLAVSAARRGLSTHLSANAPSPAHDHHALANGFVCGSADPQTVTHSKCQRPRTGHPTRPHASFSAARVSVPLLGRHTCIQHGLKPINPPIVRRNPVALGILHLSWPNFVLWTVS
jgi:hypothetical protein